MSGVLPRPPYAPLHYKVDFVSYTAVHVCSICNCCCSPALPFLMLGSLKRIMTITLDVDWLYRRLGPTLAWHLDRSVAGT